MKLSAVILTHNSSSTLSKCLRSLTFADEIIIIDDFSTDDTLKIAKSITKNIFQRKLQGNWAEQRNFSLSKTKNNWVLFLDSDEVLSPALINTIKSLPDSPSVNGYIIPRLDKFLGQVINHGEMGHTTILRLGNKTKGIWTRSVHEVWGLPSPHQQLASPIYHHRDLSISDFITRLNFYTDIDQTQLIKEHKPFSFWQLLKPPLKFFYNYIYLLGFFDGFPGLVSAYMMSLHSLIVRIKLWEKQNG